METQLGGSETLFAFPADIRRVIYTINAVESLIIALRKIIKTRVCSHNEQHRSADSQSSWCIATRPNTVEEFCISGKLVRRLGR